MVLLHSKTILGPGPSEIGPILLAGTHLDGLITYIDSTDSEQAREVPPSLRDM